MATRRTDHDVLHPVYRVTSQLRWLLLAHALVLNAARLHHVAHPAALVVACVVMVAWTVVVGRWQAQRGTRTPAVMYADLAVTLLLVASSRWVLGRAALVQTYLPVPVYWMAASPLVIAVWRGGLSGLASAVALSLVKFVQEPRPDERVWGSLVVMGVSAWGLGAVVDTLRESVADREANQARAAALAERDRLNRIVHDGALQVLAMVERQGPELGPRGSQLAEMARQQERQLRRLLQDRDVEPVPVEAPERVDVARMVEEHAAERVTVSLVSEQVLMRAERAAELDAAVSEALVNVERHAGPGAQAWVLVEDEGDEVVVSVRDNGVGMSPEQVGRAAAQGRLGIEESIMGRIAELGGLATARSQPGKGVEWELRVPIEAP